MVLSFFHKQELIVAARGVWCRPSHCLSKVSQATFKMSYLHTLEFFFSVSFPFSHSVKLVLATTPSNGNYLVMFVSISVRDTSLTRSG